MGNRRRGCTNPRRVAPTRSAPRQRANCCEQLTEERVRRLRRQRELGLAVRLLGPRVFVASEANDDEADELVEQGAESSRVPSLMRMLGLARSNIIGDFFGSLSKRTYAR